MVECLVIGRNERRRFARRVFRVMEDLALGRRRTYGAGDFSDGMYQCARCALITRGSKVLFALSGTAAVPIYVDRTGVAHADDWRDLHGRAWSVQIEMAVR